MFITTGLEVGGAESMLLQLATRLDRRLFEPVVVSLRGEGPMADRFRAAAVPLVCLRRSISGRSSTGFYRLLRHVHALRPSIIQGWMYHGNVAAQCVRSLAARQSKLCLGIRATLHPVLREKSLARLVIRADAFLSRFADASVYVSEAARTSHGRYGYRADRVLVIGNGVDTEVFRPSPVAGEQLRSALCIGPNDRIIGHVGRYHPMKDHRGFFTAAAKLAQRYEDVHFLAVGSGVDDRNAELSRLISVLGLRGRVHLLGLQLDMTKIYPALSLLVMSSWSEGFPNVIGEAMSCGVPCVATDIGDSARILGDIGSVVAPRDPDAIADACGELLDMGKADITALAQRARERIVGAFSISSVALQYQDLYLRLTDRQG